MIKGIVEKFGPLLDERGSRRRLIRVKEKILQQFVADASTLHADTKTDHLNETQFPFTRKILNYPTKV